MRDRQQRSCARARPRPRDAGRASRSGDVGGGLGDRLRPARELVAQHHTTLVFANTRRMVERVTRHLAERLGEENVAAHHGSLAKEQRFDAEQRLKAGTLKALVATASLELGIDIGDVELVCQLGSPRSISVFLQRVGRANHSVGGVPKGGCSRRAATTSSSLLRCSTPCSAASSTGCDPGASARRAVAADRGRGLGARIRRGRALRARAARVAVPRAPARIRRRRPHARRRLQHASRPTRAYLHRDTSPRLRRAAGARLTAMTCGGAIPDNADYQVILEPAETFVGTLNEDFAVESMAGRHLSAGQCLLAHPPGGDRPGTRGRREGPAAHHSVLGRRSTSAYRRVVRMVSRLRAEGRRAAAGDQRPDCRAHDR